MGNSSRESRDPHCFPINIHRHQRCWRPRAVSLSQTPHAFGAAPRPWNPGVPARPQHPGGDPGRRAQLRAKPARAAHAGPRPGPALTARRLSRRFPRPSRRSPARPRPATAAGRDSPRRARTRAGPGWAECGPHARGPWEPGPTPEGSPRMSRGSFTEMVAFLCLV